MKIDKNILQGYENMRLVRFEDSLNLPNTFAFDELPKRAVRGVSLCKPTPRRKTTSA